MPWLVLGQTLLLASAVRRNAREVQMSPAPMVSSEELRASFGFEDKYISLYGCYSVPAAALTIASPHMTVELCLRHCLGVTDRKARVSQNYFALVEGVLCKCGVSLPRPDQKKKEFDCPTPCPGIDEHTCGGPNAASIFRFHRDAATNFRDGGPLQVLHAQMVGAIDEARASWQPEEAPKEGGPSAYSRAWPGAVVTWRAKGNDSAFSQLFTEATQVLEANTCLRFVGATSNEEYTLAVAPITFGDAESNTERGYRGRILESVPPEFEEVAVRQLFASEPGAGDLKRPLVRAAKLGRLSEIGQDFVKRSNLPLDTTPADLFRWTQTLSGGDDRRPVGKTIGDLKRDELATGRMCLGDDEAEFPYCQVLRFPDSVLLQDPSRLLKLVMRALGIIPEVPPVISLPGPLDAEVKEFITKRSLPVRMRDFLSAVPWPTTTMSSAVVHYAMARYVPLGLPLDVALIGLADHGDLFEDLVASADFQERRSLSEASLKADPALCPMQELLVVGANRTLLAEAYAKFGRIEEELQSGEGLNMPEAIPMAADKCLPLRGTKWCLAAVLELEHFMPRFLHAAQEATGFDATKACGMLFLRKTLVRLLAVNLVPAGLQVEGGVQEAPRDMEPPARDVVPGSFPKDVIEEANKMYDCQAGHSDFSNVRPLIHVRATCVDESDFATTCSKLAVSFAFPTLQGSPEDRVVVKDSDGNIVRSKPLRDWVSSVEEVTLGVAMLHLNDFASPDFQRGAGAARVLQPGTYTVELQIRNYQSGPAASAELVVREYVASMPGQPHLSFNPTVLTWKPSRIRTKSMLYQPLVVSLGIKHIAFLNKLPHITELVEEAFLVPTNKLSCDMTGQKLLQRLGPGRHKVHCPRGCPRTARQEVCSNEEMMSIGSSICVAIEHGSFAKVQMVDQAGVEFFVQAVLPTTTGAKPVRLECQSTVWNQEHQLFELDTLEKEVTDLMMVGPVFKIEPELGASPKLRLTTAPPSHKRAANLTDEELMKGEAETISATPLEQGLSMCKWSELGEWQFYSCAFKVDAREDQEVASGALSYSSPMLWRKPDGGQIEIKGLLDPPSCAKEEPVAAATCPGAVCKGPGDCWMAGCIICDFCTDKRRWRVGEAASFEIWDSLLMSTPTATTRSSARAQVPVAPWLAAALGFLALGSARHAW